MKKENVVAEETIFSKIIRREIPSDIVYQDELVTAFRDISPQAPTHILIIPNILIPTVNDVTAEHEQALGRMITVAAKNRRTGRHCRRWVSFNHEYQPSWGPGGLSYPYAPTGRPPARPDAGA
ncbi:putative protein kinase C inhibitor [Salmonella enterica subsp. enterica serovar Havana]|nr:putative protein kinase C inhibitor [Salmonella enterica subsp. enterica serovar Havana]